MESRIIALVLETALAADRIGIPYRQNADYPVGNFFPAGVASWRQWVEWVDRFVDRVQDSSFVHFGGMIDNANQPILFGNIRYRAHGNPPAGVTLAPPYPILFFEEAMLANALLRAWRQIGCTSCRDHAIEMTVGVKQHYDSNRKVLPYMSHATSWGTRFTGTDQDYDLNTFWARPLLEMYSITGEAWMRQTAIDLLEASRRGAWLWRFKQAQQLGAATEPQSAHALLAGVR
jgi:hypothetical protein